MALADAPGKRPKHVRPNYRDQGKTWPSVTTILNVLSKPALERWKIRMALSGTDPEGDFTAADIGTLTHAAIAYTLGKGSQPLPDFEAYSDEVRAGAKTAYTSWRAWYAQHDVQPILMEHQMASAELGYAGTLDFFGLIDGRPEVVDWKSSSAVYGEYFIQVAAYANLLAGTSDHRAQALRIVRLSKLDPLRPHAPEVPYGDAVIEPPAGDETPLCVSPDHFRIFEHALGVYHARAAIGGGPIG